jgi:hypothetical protein
MPLKWYQRVPLVNLVYDLLFDEPPSVTNVEKLLNVFGIVSALLLGSVMGLYGSVDVGELEEADERYYNSRLEGRCKYNAGGQYSEYYSVFGGQYSFRLAFYYNMAVVCISAALFCTVLMYMCFTAHDFDNDKPAFDRWWKYGRWPVAFIMTAMMVGCCETFLAFMTLGEIKWPVDCMKTEDSLDFKKGWLSGMEFYSLQLYGVFFPLFFTLMFMSLASTSRYELEERDEQRQITTVNAFSRARSVLPIPTAWKAPDEAPRTDVIPATCSGST